MYVKEPYPQLDTDPIKFFLSSYYPEIVNPFLKALVSTYGHTVVIPGVTGKIEFHTFET